MLVVCPLLLLLLVLVVLPAAAWFVWFVVSGLLFVLASACAGCVSPVVGVVLFAFAVCGVVVWFGLPVGPG